MAEEVMSPTLLKKIYAFVLIVGVGFYFVWGFTYDAFLDYANYTVSIILILTGLIGTFLYRELEREKAKAQAQK